MMRYIFAAFPIAHHVCLQHRQHSSAANLFTFLHTTNSHKEEDFKGDANEDEMQQQDEMVENDGLLDYAIDSFISGDYAYQFAENAPSPNPSLTAGETIDLALRALRQLDNPEPAHGAAVMMRFCIPLSRAERWGDTNRPGRDPWKEVLRGSLTPEMFAKRLRASGFAGLLDWATLDVTEGTSHTTRRSTGGMSDDIIFIDTPNLAFVNAALFFGSGTEPSLIQFTLKRWNRGVWMIDTAQKNQKELFVSRNDNGVS